MNTIVPFHRTVFAWVSAILVSLLTSCSATRDEAPSQSVVALGSVQPAAPPSYMRRSSTFSVRVRDSTGAWKSVDVIGDINGYDYAHFSVGGGGAMIQVTAVTLSNIASYTITPIKDNFSPSVSGNTLTYSIPIDRYTIVSVAGVSRNLIVAADPLYNAPAPNAANVFNVMNFAGVKNDRNNISNTTAGIQSAIDAATAYGQRTGGRGIVYVPAGAYAVGNLVLKSNTELFLADGAAFFFASNIAGDQWNYTYRTDWTTKGNGTRWITAQEGASGIKIWGRGTLDGNALHTGNFYNNVLVFNNNHDVTVDGIIIKSGSKWGTIVGRSDSVTFNNVKFFQDMSGVGENDAIDVVESQNVVVKYSIAASFDDPFSVKTYVGDENYVSFGGNHEQATNILFDSVIAWTGCHALKIGQGAAQTIDHVTFQNSVVFDAAHAISLHHKTGAGTVQNITWQNIDVQRISQVNLGRSWAYFNIEGAQGGVGPVDALTVQQIRVRDLGTDPTPIDGYDGSRSFRGIWFRNVYVGPTGAGHFAQNAGDLRLAPNAFVSDLEVTR
jgi:hypothetical protein